MIFEAGQTYYVLKKTRLGSIYAAEKLYCIKVGKRFLLFQDINKRELRRTVREMAFETYINEDQYKLTNRLLNILLKIDNMSVKAAEIPWPYDPALVNELSTNVNALKQTLDRLKGVSSCPSS